MNKFPCKHCLLVSTCQTTCDKAKHIIYITDKNLICEYCGFDTNNTNVCNNCHAYIKMIYSSLFGKIHI